MGKEGTQNFMKGDGQNGNRPTKIFEKMGGLGAAKRNPVGAGGVWGTDDKS